jgi:hypothetical protein
MLLLRPKSVGSEILSRFLEESMSKACSAARAVLAAAAILVSAALFLPVGAFAGCTGSITQPKFAQIQVVGNGSEYVDVEDIGYGWSARLNVECGTLGRVKAWEIAPAINVNGVGTLDFRLYGASDSYPTFSRPKRVHRTEGVIFPDVYIQNFAVSACNTHADLLREDGFTNDSIFGQDQVIALRYWVRAEVETTFDGDSIFLPAEFDPTSWGNVWTSIRFTEIICKKWTGPPEPIGDELTQDSEFELLVADLVLFPTSWEGACPKDMLMIVRVEGNLNRPVAVQVESTAGWKSDEGVLATSDFQEATGRWRGEETEYLPIPVLLPTKPPSDGDILPSPVDDFAAAGLDGPSGPDWTPAIDAVDPGSNVHAESLRLIASAGGQTITTDWQGYHYTCEPKTAVEGPGVIVSPDANPRPTPARPAPAAQ